ncbi:MAG: HEAT repeat domain-containing protein [Planctomycetota bacterium]|jgi:hypothetical protein
MNRLVVIVLLIAGAVSAVGCNNSQGAKKKFRFFPPSKDELLADAVNPDDPDTRREAITELSDSSAVNEQAVQDLFDLILRSDSNSFVRAAASTALGKAQNPQYVPTLAKAMTDPAMVVRWDTARALDRVIGKEAVGPLMTAASDDPSLDVRVAATRSLRNYHGPAVVRRLVVLMDDPELPIRREAHNSLKDVFGVDFGPSSEDWAQAHTGEIPPGPTMDDKRREALPRWKRWAYRPKPPVKDEPTPEEPPVNDADEKEDATEAPPADDEKKEFILPAGPGEQTDEKAEDKDVEAPVDTSEGEGDEPQEPEVEPQEETEKEKDTAAKEPSDPDAPSPLPEFQPAVEPSTDTDKTDEQEPAEAPAAEPAEEEEPSPPQPQPEPDESTPAAEPTPPASDIAPPERPTRPETVTCPPSASQPHDSPEPTPEEPPAEAEE